ncbi:Ribonucleases P/MRP protein subunit POP1 [Cyberlindnera fabianii]|uniref:Ribonucleases P/MRP protein subunit POP1 n=1 Tax=Cyberlindnera fabianii TaxID=36022 RepID=A0A1V2LAF1_CYBFA|nr:Ribonucleases P/MRP protein subunit POP1 [Cyberlindnera fabianii]
MSSLLQLLNFLEIRGPISTMSNKQMDSKQYRLLKRRQSRQIRSETNDPALNKEGILDVSSFLKSRKFEITELEKAQLNSKFASSTRTFQSLPRTLRRRTASHNVKRIPKRLRKRAIREMSSDTGVTQMKRTMKGRELYRAKMASSLLRLAARAQLNKQLPNDKNLSMGKLKIRQRLATLKKQLREAKEGHFIPMNNTIGSYDNSMANGLAPQPLGKMKYIKRQRQYVWLNSHVWHAKRAHMIKRWGWQIPLKPTQKCFRAAHRSFNVDGAMAWDKSYVGTCVLQSDNESSVKHIVGKLINDDATKKVINHSAVSQKLCYDEDGAVLGEVTILSFRSDEGSRVVIRAHPAIYEKVFNALLKIKTEDVEVIDNRYSIGSIELTGPISLNALATILKPWDPKSAESQLFGKLCTAASLPDKTVFTFQAQDPRLANRCKPRPPQKDSSILDIIIDMKTTKANINPTVITNLLTSSGRTASYEGQMSLKQVAREKNKPAEERTKGNGFPVIIYRLNDVWTLLLPWYWTLPVWHCLLHIAHMRLGGIKQSHQYNFEKGQLFFPVDFPFTAAGDVENKFSADVKRGKWSKKPVSKRVNYEKLHLHKEDCARGELGDPFGCDWRYLQALRIGLTQVKSETNTRTSEWENFQRKIVELHDVYSFIEDVKQGKTKSSDLPIKLCKDQNVTYPSSVMSELPIVPVEIETLERGNAQDNARLYAIPPEALTDWMASLNERDVQGLRVHKNLEVPHSKYLIGFLSSATYNLSSGKNTGVGCVDAVWAQKKEKYVLVRNVGTDHARVATWKSIDI